MGLILKSEVKKLLRKYRISPSKRLGQNFLIDKVAVRKIITAADLQPSDVILEIGPGLGALTLELAKRAKRVIAVEKDPKMIEILKETLKDSSNVKVIKGDILRINPEYYIPNTKYKSVGNLPFYLTAPVIRKFLESPSQPSLMALVVQKEVAQRICAKVPDMNLLAVSVQFYAQPKIISYISKKSFWPQPEVDAAVIKIQIPKSKIQNSDRNLFFKIVRSGFSQPRKQLANNLSQKLKIDKEKVKKWLLENNIQPAQRAETLSVEDWISLTKSLK